jgi:uncharacterized protein (DUF2147 family)
MRLTLVAALAATLVTAAPGRAAGAPTSAYLGRWLTESDGGVVEIYPCGAALCGRVVTSNRLRANPDTRDTKNRNQRLRGRRMAGTDLLSGLEPDGRGWRGRLYNPEDGETYAGTMRLDGRGGLRVQGCVLYVLCRSQRWTRVG